VDNFGDLLRKMMEKNNVSPRELALRTGYSKRAIHFWMKGERTPSIKTADILLKALNEELTIGGKSDVMDKHSK